MLADLPFDSNAIIVFVAVVFAAVKALIEKRQKGREYPEPESDHDEESQADLYDQYEAELERQRREAGLFSPQRKSEPSPPPLPVAFETPKPSTFAPVKKPRLSAAEKAALANFKKQSSRQVVQKRQSGSTRSRVMKQLSSPTAAREALLLGEILGPPKALRGDQNL